MTISRLFLPLLFALALLFSQQAGAAHALSHAVEQSQQQDQHTSHSPACEKCASYAQLGSALNGCSFDHVAVTTTDGARTLFIANFTAAPTPIPIARGPPQLLQKIA